MRHIPVKNTADVIIVGAGAIGNAAAWNLAKLGKSVIVLEKSEYIGHGGSSRNGGGVRQSGRDPRELPLIMHAVEHIWPELSDELGMDIEYYKEGNLRLGKTQQHLEILQDLTNKGQAGGLEMHMVDQKQAKDICPYLSDEVIGASWCPTDGHANPLLTTLAYYRAARRLGVRFISGEGVVAIKKRQGRARYVITENDNIYEGETILVIAGLGSRQILNTVGIDIPMHSALMECLVTEEAPPMFNQMLGTAMADFYGHQSTHGSFVFGGSAGYEDFASGYSEPPRPGSLGAGATCRGIMGYFPKLKNLKIVRTWSGWLDVCADHVPVISTTEEVPGLVIGCAFSGHGFGISPIAGLLLAQLAAEEQTILDVSEFRYNRFVSKI